jgi:hypothetical protein
VRAVIVEEESSVPGDLASTGMETIDNQGTFCTAFNEFVIMRWANEEAKLNTRRL